MKNPTRQRKIKLYVTVITFVALLAISYSIRDEIMATIANLRSATLWPIIAIVPLAFLNHFVLGKLYQSVFRILGDRFRTRSMIRLSLELNFVNLVFPSAGVSGFSYLGIRMKGEEIEPGKSALVQAMRFTMLFISFQLLLGVGLLLLSLVGRVNNFVILVAASLSTLLFVGTILVGFIVSSKQRINGFFTGLTKVTNRLIQIVRPKHPETINIKRVEKVFTDLHNNYKLIRSNITELRRPILFAFASNVTEITSVYLAFTAFGATVNPGAIIIAYAVANFAGVLSILPGGIGVYEGLMTGVLVATGVPVAVSLPAIVTFRVVSMLSQVPAGYYFYQKNLTAHTHL
ncbi:MAG: flippase-like domain-containing protein [Actinobacteria bacterium]|nr:flippase-like domain-containing protein [Actinomycetota bacterium]